MEKILEMRHIKKEYLNIPVLNDVNLTVTKGEIHALLGENGAGKSTLMNILFGLDKIRRTGGYSGEIIFEGKQLNRKNHKYALDLGIGMVHQELYLIDNFTAEQNISLNHEKTTPTFFSKIFGKSFETIDKTALKKNSDSALSDLGIKLDAKEPVGIFSSGQRQMVELAREISRKDLKLLVFDEPTAALNEKEAENLLQIMKKLSCSGISILFITHKLNEVMRVADSITILKEGKTKAELLVKDTTKEEIARLMIGKSAVEMTKKKNVNVSKTMVSISGLMAKNNTEPLYDINLKIYEGEMFGIGGLAGEGRSSLGRALCGGLLTEGELNINGNVVNPNNIKSLYQSKMAFVGEDRRKNGILSRSSVMENICFSALQTQNRFLKKQSIIPIVDKKEMKEWSEKMVELLDIRCSALTQPAGELSGGNQQKIALARALTLEPDVLVVCDVTKGVDIGARQKILETLRILNQTKNMTVLMFSSDLSELRSMCSRIAIIKGGRVNGVLDTSAEISEFARLFTES